jgi:thiol:disulfide interchange protein DsbD
MLLAETPLKVLGFVRRASRCCALAAAGLVYTAGMVASFVALAVLLLALRAGSEQLGWGFQAAVAAVRRRAGGAVHRHRG